DIYSRQEENKLSFIGSSQCQKIITTYSALSNAVGNAPTGKRLPSSFHASPANRKKRQLDAMSVVTRKGKPHLMVTMTCNGNWPEIQDNLLPGQCALDRSDLCNRVFKIKLKSLMHDLTHNLFGIAQYFLSVTEFQKRGLVQGHLVIKFEGLSPEARHELDTWIWMTLPDESIAGGKLCEKVIKYMINQKCGEFNPNAACMTTCSKTKRKFCSKHCPQAFAYTLSTKTSSGRAEYRRIDNGDKATIKQRNGNGEYVENDVDNRYVVPYNTWLLMKYDCHSCVDLVTAKVVVAYLYKYCFKGKDMAKAKVLFEGYENKAYRSIRYISSSEAMWRMCGYDMQQRSPNVILLFVHLENEPIVVHDEADDEPQRRAKVNKSRANDSHDTDSEDSGSNSDSLHHNPPPNPHRTDVYGNYVYARLSECVCRVNFLKLDAGDIWYLCLLLHHVAASSWNDKRTVQDALYNSHEQAARQLGLVQDSEEYLLAFQDAITFSTPRELRQLLVTLIIAGAPTRTLWDTHSIDMTSDYSTRTSNSSANDQALRHIDLMLSKHGKSTAPVGLPPVMHIDTEYDRLIAAFDTQDMRKEADDLIPKLNNEQKTVFNEISNSVRTNKGGIFMIDAPAGSGKTFTMCALAADIRAKGNLVLCTASTGIAALLLPGGLTAHSTFEIPFGDKLVEGAFCNVKSETERAEVLRRASLIIWDEIPMANKLAPEALDLTLRDLRKCNRPFGGATILMSGDWRQVGPVVPFGTADDVVDAALMFSYLWKHVKRFRLTQSMRDRLDEPYSKAARAIGEGKISPITLPDKSEIIPLQYTTTTVDSDSQPSTSTAQGVVDFQHLIDFVYPDLLTADPTLSADRGILAPTSVSIDEINNRILNLLPNTTRSLLSSNSILKSSPNDIAEVTSPEFLEAVDVPGVPPHNLRLKVGSVIMFIRNVNFDTGIVNGVK
ncbi:unnamed protein product, partial [Laminaria digitata]